MLPVRDHLPTRTVPFVNYGLIAANITVFAVAAFLISDGADPKALTEELALVPGQLVTNPVAAAPGLLTHMFMHGGLAHIAGNLLFLWIFGDNVEDALGHARYLLFYLLCGLLAALAQVAAGPFSMVPMIGASGAIAGVLAAYAVLYPRSPITVINPIPLLWLVWGLFLSLPAWFVIAEFFVVNLWNAVQPANPTGGVAFVAHIGGFVSGLVLLLLLRKHEPVEYDRFKWRMPSRSS
jgi:membrane associated rhomboid family serine protease